MPPWAPLGCTKLTAPSPCCPGAQAQTCLECTVQVSSVSAAQLASAFLSSSNRRLLCRLCLMLLHALNQHEHSPAKWRCDVRLRVTQYCRRAHPCAFNLPSNNDEQRMQRALTSSPSTRRAPDERSLIQWRVILFWPQRRRDAAKKGSWQAFYRQQQAAKWLPGLQAAPTIRQPRRLDLQGVLPHHLTMAQVPGLGARRRQAQW